MVIELRILKLIPCYCVVAPVEWNCQPLQVRLCSQGKCTRYFLNASLYHETAANSSFICLVKLKFLPGLLQHSCYLIIKHWTHLLIGCTCLIMCRSAQLVHVKITLRLSFKLILKFLIKAI